MSTDTLKDLYLDQVKDIYSACKQSMDMTKELTKHAIDPALTKALDDGADGIKRGMETMSDIAKGHDVSPSGEHCHGMEGLVSEAKSDVLKESYGDDDVRDASIIAQYQRMAHYAIAGYGTIHAFAKRLGLEDDARRIAECLDKSYDGDRRFTEIATDHVNVKAA